MQVMDLGDVVMRLVGPVTAVGETREDEKRLENLRELTALVERLLLVLHSVAPAAERQEASMKKIGMHARDFLRRECGDKQR